ncbi:hypothetical protein F4779DRAFT_617624 [Xylariaceae sp. FL0662B]|nr:hypothetical protein F4779DRAFT_617624 [Xylariaceae sp. FL0662B]
MPGLPSLIAFGALAPWPSPDQLSQLRLELQQNLLLEPITAALRNLESLWKSLTDQDQDLKVVPGQMAVRKLAELAGNEAYIHIANEKQNMMTLPITIVIQLVQYLSYLEHNETSADHESILQSVAAGGGVQGFCAGLLSALAVASGTSKEEVAELAATSVKLAFCIGAYVDLDQMKDGSGYQSSNLAVRWKTPAALDNIQRILPNHPKTYIAVSSDVGEATITTLTSAVRTLQEELSCRGISLFETGLRGRYHSSLHTDVPVKIISACQGFLDSRFGNQALVRSNADAQIIPRDNAVRVTLESILTYHSNWYLTITSSVSALGQLTENPFILSIGKDAIPPSVMRSYQVAKIKTITPKASRCSNNLTSIPRPGSRILSDGIYPENSIAVIGMACKFPGADSIDEFWDLLTEGRSMLGQMPEPRFNINHLARSPAGLRFWGNFIREIECFDHKFFKKSARESASMDPQQRLLLQVAYQALESSGYFSDSSKPRDIGCYLGACSTDYDSNVGSHPPTAYSTTGTLRAFLSGRLSHYFGWSGPSLTFDTACSSSAVAIHTACTALQLGECSQAVAGGITLITSPYLYENLSAAHFLSPSGATKPFDAAADGYCRGEGVGLVVLKKLSDAVSNGENILGVIASTAVNQNANCVSITVPHSASQSKLYQRAHNKAGITPHEVAFVEAHGTGTPVGDPIEMESIREVFGGPKRSSPLFVSSVKGNIGHLEGASGVAALIKALLQMENRTACSQASFSKLNPKIPSLEADKMCIPTYNRSLSGNLVTACINNYGAAGSNATMILIEAPYRQKQHSQSIEQGPIVPPDRFPIQIAAGSTSSLLDYCKLLKETCQEISLNRDNSQKSQLLASIAFHLARQQNQDLSYMLTTTVTDIYQLASELRAQSDISNAIKQRPEESPLILCFGGQIGQHVGLSQRFWQECSLFRFHLDLCNETLRSLGYPEIYPVVFQTEPIDDVVALQSAVFSVQYSCASAWIGSGLKIDGLIGHSLGQITALCISGSLSLQDGLKLVAGRASLMRDHWGPEPGTMIAVESDEKTIKDIADNLAAADADRIMEIACYNGPTSLVTVSDKTTADQVELELVSRSIRHRRLNVTNGFHSRFTDPMIPHLEALASSLSFNKAKIPIETCTDGVSWSEPTAQLVAAHTRDPVFFGQAVQRTQNRFGPCTFLEAGSDSSVVSMARRALSQSTSLPSNFIPMELTKDGSLEKLVDVTVELWDRGHRFQFWNFHRLQAHRYDVLRLPPYQFEKHKHWLELEMPVPGQTSMPPSGTPAPSVLLRSKFADTQGRTFDVDSRSEEYQTLVQGHIVLGKAECPLSLYVELVSRAVKSVGEVEADRVVLVQDLQVESPLGLALNRSISLQLQRLGEHSWNFQITSQPQQSTIPAPSTIVCHATGIVSLRSPETASLQSEFERFERLASHGRVLAVMDDPNGTSIKGPMVYKVLSVGVEYSNFYRNVKITASSESQVVGRVLRPAQVPVCLKGSVIRPHLLDSFLQIVDLHANCIRERLSGEVFWLSGVEGIQFGRGYEHDHGENDNDRPWDVLCFESGSARELAYDIFVYDAITGRLAVYLLGVRLIKIQRSSLIHVLSLADEGGVDIAAYRGEKSLDAVQVTLPVDETQKKHTDNQPPPARTKVRDTKSLIYEDLCIILERIAEVQREEVKGSAGLEELGVDSLMMIEVIAEISSFYGVELPIEDLEQLTDIDSLVEYLHKRGCRSSEGGIDTATVSSATPSTSNSGSASSFPTAPVTRPPSRVSQKEHQDGKPSVIVDNTLAKNVTGPQDRSKGLRVAQQVFENIRFDFDKYGKQTGFTSFWEKVYPNQASLVDAYTIEAFCGLGCDIHNLAPGQVLPPIQALPRYENLVQQLRKILVESEYLHRQNDGSFRRTTKIADLTPAAVLFKRMLEEYPQHSSETKLLNVAGSQLVACMSGKTDPLQLLFANRANREIMADVYENAPMCQATTRLLADFLARSFSSSKPGGVFQILEVGGGTGGTAKYVVEYLASQGVAFEYTFTDISNALVGQAKKTFAGRQGMKFATFDCDREPPPDLYGKFDAVISTNCIHATKNATSSATNIAPLLREDGVFCLVEFTRGLYWFDLVYGLLDGWWVFSDGRQHALADQWFWDQSLRTAGFRHVSWTDGDSNEAQTMRVICGFKAAAEKESYKPLPRGVVKRAGLLTETLIWKREGDLELKADLYFPKVADDPAKRRPIALMIHGGGHLLFGRQDIPMKHVRTLLKRGFFPVSVDYRLCPEMSLFEGPMTDCCDALRWARETLPFLPLSIPHVRVDPSKLIALGWSSGGQLAMSLGYTARPRDIQPPDVILPFYSPSNLEDEFWYKPQYPKAAEEGPTEIWGELDCVRESPILDYAPLSNKKGAALSLTTEDPRARMILHMMWTGQSVPVLVHGLPHKSRVAPDDETNWKALPQPPIDKIRECSPYWNILQGNYRTPTFMAHGNNDDWLPYQMTEKTIEALRERGVACGIRIAEQCGHAFDLWPAEDKLGVGWAAIEPAYDFACSQLGMS